MKATESRAVWRACALACALLASAVYAQGGAPRLALQVPGELRVGQHAFLTLTVELPPEAGEPLLLTPYREGAALEVVKGRLLRSDALDPKASVLKFELPVMASAEGTALVGVRLLAYLCTPRCRAIELETRAQVVVLGRR